MKPLTFPNWPRIPTFPLTFNNHPDDPDFDVYNIPWRDYLPPVEEDDE